MVKSGKINSLENLTKFQNETFFLTQASIALENETFITDDSSESFCVCGDVC